MSPELVLMHWLMALLFVLALGGIVSRGLLPAGHGWRPFLRSAHMLIGQIIFLAALARIVLRWRSPMALQPGTPQWVRWASRCAHGLLYLVMIAQPVSGVLFMQAGDKTVTLFGLALPNLMPSDPQLHFQLKELHLFAGNAFYALITLHVAAALWHHYLRRDDTLQRMLRLARPGSPGPTGLAEVRAADPAIDNSLRRIA